MEGEFDTQASGSEMTDIPDPTGTQTDTPDAGAPEQAQDASIQAGSEEGKEGSPVSPFASGKEKFKVGGKEVEWDWATTKRFAQLGYSGQKAMEKAANLEKQAKTTWQQIQSAAINDLPGLYRVLTGRELSPAAVAALKGASPGAKGVQGATDPQDDPRAHEIHELKSEVGSLKEVLEKQALAEEAKAIESELDAAVKEFPELDDPAYRHYVKAQYRRQLEQGIEDVTLNDVAFYVSQQIKERTAEREKKKLEARKTANSKAPVSQVPGSRTGDQQKPMTREDVLRLAGRIS